MSSESVTIPPPYSATAGQPDLTTARIRDLDQDRYLTPGERGNEAIVRAFGPVVYGIAAALVLEDPSAAERIAPAVFQTFNVRWRKLRKRTLLALWFFQTTIIAAKAERKRLELPQKPVEPVQVALSHLSRLRPKLRDPLVLCEIFALGESSVATMLRTKDRRVSSRVSTALKKLQNRVRKTGARADALLAGIVALAPKDVAERIITRFSDSSPLVKETISGWRRLTFRRVIRRTLLAAVRVLCVLAILFGTFIYLATHGYLMPLFIKLGQRDMVKKHPEVLVPARPWPATVEDRELARNAPPKAPEELFQMTNIWPVKLTFRPDQWRKIAPSHVPPVGDIFNGGRIILRNPKAKRSGLAGVLGFEFNWVEARLNFGGERFDAVGVRYRGNGTFVNSLYGPKQSLKLDVSKFAKTNRLAGIHELNFLNTIVDYSYLHDVLAEELFRELGAIAPRTAYAYVTLDPGTGKDEPRGLFVAMENIDSDFAEHRFGTRKAPIFKPVTYDLFEDLGDDWSAYDKIYDLKTKATPEEQQRVIDFAKLVSHATDEEFARRLPEFLDFDEFAAFLGGHVLLSSYDGFLVNGQNFYVYLDPRSHKFGFVPWDQDHAWGDFGHVGTNEGREGASIWEPAIYDFRFLKRVMKAESFRAVYRAKLENALTNSFSKETLFAKVDDLAKRIRPAVAAESDFRLKRFDQAISNEWLPGPRDGNPEGPDAPVHQIKRFISNRIQSVRAQLDGRDKGHKISGFR
jgi:hypothetical protein